MMRVLESSVTALPMTIERDDVLYFLGYPEHHSPISRIAGLVGEVLVEARRLVSARGGWARLNVEDASKLHLDRVDATGLIVGLVTIGGRIEQRATELFDDGEATLALLMDAAGSAAVEEAADRLGAIIAGSDPTNRNGRAAHVSCRISPGYGRWPIAAQRPLFEILPHADLSVSLLPSMLMVPRKSVSFAMWLGADARPIAGLSGCSRCELEHCRYRRVAR